MAQLFTRTSAARVLPRRLHSPIEYDDAPSHVRVIGVVVPFDFELDWEYWRYLPPDVELSFTRTPYLRQPVGLRLARDVGRPTVVARGVKALRATVPDVTLYACSSGSFVRGLEGEAELRRVMLEAGARHAVTSSGAMLEALKGIGARRVAVATPYTRSVTGKLVDFLEEAGHEVVGAVYLGLNGRISQVSQATIAELIRDAAHPDADAVFVSCTALRTFGVVAELEEEIGRPILTSNQVSLWSSLRAARLLPEAAEETDWVMGGGDPMSDSTAMLLRAVGAAPE